MEMRRTKEATKPKFKSSADPLSHSYPPRPTFQIQVQAEDKNAFIPGKRKAGSQLPFSPLSKNVVHEGARPRKLFISGSNDGKTRTSSASSGNRSTKVTKIVPPTEIYTEEEEEDPKSSSSNISTEPTLESGPFATVKNHDHNITFRPRRTTTQRASTDVKSHSATPTRISLPRRGKQKSSRKPKTYLFHIPTADELPYPRAELLRYFHDKALENSADDDHTHCHQKKLHGSGLLSLEDTLIPAVAESLLGALKDSQAKVQRNQDPQVKKAQVSLAMDCRKMLIQSTALTIRAVKQHRIQREQEAERVRAEQKRALVEEKRVRVEEKRQRKEERRLEKIRQKEERRKMKEERTHEKLADREKKLWDKKKNYPRNKAMWREVMLLMTDLARLQKEEKSWKDAEKMLHEKQRHVETLEIAMQSQEQRVRSDTHPRATSTHDESKGEEQNLQDTNNISSLTEIQNLIQDIIVSSNRIHVALQDVLLIMDESDNVKKELFLAYKESGTQFQGYKGMKNPKNLIRALVADDY